MSEAKTLDLVPRQEAEPAARVPATAITPMQMLSMAIERGADIAMMEKLLSLQERWEANEARKAFVSALAAFKADPPTVVKNKHAGFTSKRTSDRTDYDYLTLDQACAVIGPALSKHGLSHRWVTEQIDGKVKVTCVLMHALGHTERVTLESGADTSGSKNAIQAIGSAATYLARYTLMMACGLAAKGMDDDAIGATSDAGGDNGCISAEQKSELVGLIKDTATDTVNLLTTLYKTPPGSLDELLAEEFDFVKSALLRKKAAQAKAKEPRA